MAAGWYSASRSSSRTTTTDSAPLAWLDRLPLEKSASAAFQQALRDRDLAALLPAWRAELPAAIVPLHRVALWSTWSCGVGVPAEWQAAIDRFEAVHAQASTGGLVSRLTRRAPVAEPAPTVLARALLDASTSSTSTSAPDADVRDELPARAWLVLTLLEILARFADLPAELAPALWSTVVQGAPALLKAQRDWGPGEDDLALLVEGELPYTLGLLLPQLAGAEELVRRGRKVIQQQLREQLDTDGTPHAQLVPRLPLWLASALRSARWARWCADPQWTPTDTRRLQNVLIKGLALSGGDGRQVLMNGLPVSPLPALEEGAKWLGLDTPWQRLAASYRQAGGASDVARRARVVPPLAPSVQSDWAHLALLRSDWSVDAPRLAITHDQPLPVLDVSLLGQTWLHGTWPLAIETATTSIELADEWSCVCWNSDEDVDYAELQMEGPDGLRVERIVLLARKEQFLIVGDSISGAGSGPLTVRSRLPLAGDVVPTPGARARDWKLALRRQFLRMMPLACEADRGLPDPHAVDVTEEGLLLTYRLNSGALFAPIVIDWNPQRARSAVTWRPLTVSENGRRAAADAACAYRLQLGEWQLLIYRSLRKPIAARAVLGLHTNHEFVVSRFDRNGDTTHLLLVDSE